MTSTEELIGQLSTDLEPTPKLPPLGMVVGLWLLASTVYVLGLAALLGPFREGFLGDLSADPFWAVEVIAGYTAVGLMAWAALSSTMPGQSQSLVLRIGALCGLAWLIGVVVDWLPVDDHRHGLTAADPMLGKRPHCIWETLVLTALPLAVAIRMQRKRYSVDKTKSVLLAGGGSAVLSAWTMQMACMHEASHSLAFHLAPALGVAVVAAAVTHFLLKD